MIPDAAVEAAAAMMYERSPARHITGESWRDVRGGTRDGWILDATAALEAAAPHVLAPLLALADERDVVRGTIRGHVTTHELRTMLGAGNE